MMIMTCSGGWVHGNYAEKIRAAAKLGYKAVEPLCWLGEDLRAARQAMDETGCVISCILIQSANREIARLIDNSHGIVHEDAKEAFAAALAETIAAAKVLGCKKIVFTSGNERFDVSRAAQHHNIIAAIQNALPLLEDTGITIVLEPLNALADHKGYYLTTSRECAEVIRAVNHSQVKMLFDVYHQQITEGNLMNNITAYAAEIGHYHLGDVPGRNEPGTGEINYKNVLRAIKATGYDNFVVLECGCTGSVEEVSPRMFALLEE
ncbi:MAG: TIM barrel protein [Oscillospiraceae bacterium]|jgi:hydroxypyruvate isomerase|nr:TIM barrel protein [Oscillospiraceae bacterium]